MAELLVQRLEHGAGLPLPRYQSAGAAGLDALAAIAGDQLIPPGGRALVPTGLAVAVPEGHELQVRARSGLALRDGLFVLNAPGTIDSDYRGEVQVLLANFGDRPIRITRGMRVAQLVLAPIVEAVLKTVESLPESGRGRGGFGSTGRQ